ncbi:terpenoid synthase [Pleomassaria siparia CBS 279.74]|uniref:geranylgeranyl diphosphate synthase n=1 Tax=Pleomassaria siparia CBS 279.74 TaxID=1314801 RepID=A0A6G1K7D0_9PLEO|nr:terpenoid synthase [Pleomassaria siparia CBS 279.74]
MEYQYSKILSPSEYRTDGLCDGIEVRKNIAADLEEIGTIQAQEDWSNLVERLEGYKGGLGPMHSFMAVSLPECLPERFEIVCYANEFAFLHDDMTDVVDKQASDAANNDMLDAFHHNQETKTSDCIRSGKRQMQAKILNTMMQLDKDRTMTAMKAWASFLEQGSGRQHDTAFRTLEEYLPYRCKDVGHMFWHALVTFGCALTIPENEFELCEELVLPAVIAASLTNDLFSYEKELEAAQKSGRLDVVNGLWYLMLEHKLTLEEAKVRCRNRIKVEVAKYVQTVQEVRYRVDLSDDTKRYIELMQYSISGNVVWSQQCPRYNKQATYNQRQRLRMTHGDPQYPTIQQLPTNSQVALPCCETRETVEQGKAEGSEASPEPLEVTLGEVISLSDSGPFPMKRSESICACNTADMAFCMPLPLSAVDVILEPFNYISALPSKGVRDMVINALECWLKVPEESGAIIGTVINIMHTSSLMLDDVQDRSPLRRGQPSAHTIFGESQTINSATFQYLEAIAQLRRLNNPKCIDIFIEDVRSIFVGQSHDLLWVWEQICPSVSEYLQMVDGKTGGTFRLLIRLMAAEAGFGVVARLDRLCRLLGRYFQIRDDYQNLVSREYNAQKGMCEDLDEGKYSLPLIHALSHTVKSHQIRGLISQRHIAGGLTVEQKRLMLDLMHEAGSFAYTVEVLYALHSELMTEIERLEEMFGKANHEFRLLLEILKV